MFAWVSVLLVAFLLSSASTLHITPNSPCASVCLDDPTQVASNPNVSSTHGFDIVCQDSDYSSTAVGEKFERCLNCLQNSSATASGENDQAWFLCTCTTISILLPNHNSKSFMMFFTDSSPDNLRFAFNTCVFDTVNATDPVSTPCSVDTVCGHLEDALSDGMSDPSTVAQYGYCSASQSAFLGSDLGACRQCLAEASNEHFLSNCRISPFQSAITTLTMLLVLIALAAGCTQQPPAGMRIGLNGTVFSSFEVVPTFPQASGSTGTKNKSLSTAAIIGIAVAGGILLVILAAILFVGIRKHRNFTRLKALRSPLDPRFGARNITAPNKGAYTSPQSSPHINPDSVPMKLVPMVHYGDLAPDTDDEWYDPPLQESSTLSPGPPSYSPPNSGRESIMPTHHAYIPQYRPASRNSTSPLYSPPNLHQDQSQSRSPPDSARSAPPTTTPSSQPSSARSLPGIYTNQQPLSARSMPTPQIQRSPPPPIFIKISNETHTTPIINTNPTITSSNFSASTNPNTNIATRAPSFSRHLSRDLTSGSMSSRRYNKRLTPVEISRPIMRVESRFENEAQTRAARERLYRDGLGGTMTVDANSRELPEVQEKERSPESAVSEEQWPGSF